MGVSMKSRRRERGVHAPAPPFAERRVQAARNPSGQRRDFERHSGVGEHCRHATGRPEARRGNTTALRD